MEVYLEQSIRYRFLSNFMKISSKVDKIQENGIISRGKSKALVLRSTGRVLLKFIGVRYFHCISLYSSRTPPVLRSMEVLGLSPWKYQWSAIGVPLEYHWSTSLAFPSLFSSVLDNNHYPMNILSVKIFTSVKNSGNQTTDSLNQR